uniref:Uncharacterized protein n=1 Tax=Rhizophora mucronata TaxID=61149 RepID=A0A2P2N5D5_RHIMU
MSFNFITDQNSSNKTQEHQWILTSLASFFGISVLGMIINNTPSFNSALISSALASSGSKILVL